jgi:hypothetical protein
MIMALFRGMHRLDHKYSAISVREAKYTHLGYRTKLSRLHTLDPHIALAFLRGNHSATSNLEQENNQEPTSNRSACDKVAQLGHGTE